MTFIEILERREFLSTSWYVSPKGSNQNPGTLKHPFKTIQKAANVARPGDFVEIEAGVYREDVKPRRSGTAAAPITFEAYNGQSVTVSGADIVRKWSGASGDIYHARVKWDLGEGNNQVFVDGHALNEARWPNTSLDLSHPTLATADSVTLAPGMATLYDTHLTQPANFWAGAIIHIVPGQAWRAQTGTVVSSAPGQITFRYLDTDPYLLPTAGNQYYLTAAPQALDSAGEWYLSQRTLSLWTPNSDSPSRHLVEVKRRDYAFDLSGRSNITIQHITIFAATINTDSASAGTVLNHLSAFYTSQFLHLDDVFQQPSNAGILLNGPSSLLENSLIAYSAGDGVFVNGAGSRVTNNIIHDVDTSGANCAGIRILAPNVQADHNTIYNAGRDGIMHTAQNLRIFYNTIHDVGLLTTDAGGIYTHHIDGGGTEIAFNTIYSMHSAGFGHTGLYLDDNSKNYVVDNNNVFDVDTAIKLNYTSENNDIFNNTLGATEHSVFGNFVGDWNGTQFVNNIFLAPAAFGPGVVKTNNVTSIGIAGTGAASFTSGVVGNVGA